MARRRAQVAAIGAFLLAGCGSSDPAPTPVACFGEPRAIERALTRAPARVRLAGGTAVSRCVSLAAQRDGDLQSLGVSLTRVADDLHFAARNDPRAALRLGYLIGAVRRGAAKTTGIAAQLARRIEQTGSLEGGPFQAEVLRGVAFGEETG